MEYGYEISLHEPLPYATLLSLMKAVSVIAGFLQHVNINTFIKHYLPRRVTANVRAIISGYEPQKNLMQAICQCARWNRRFKDAAYGSDIVNLRLRLRAALLGKLRNQWDIENPMNEVELQLSGLKFNDNPGTKVQVVDEILLMQKHLVEMVMTMLYNSVLLETTDSGQGSLPAAGGRGHQEASAERCYVTGVHGEETYHLLHMLKRGKFAIRKAHVFIASPGDLTKHFKRKHLSNIRGRDWIGCKGCQMPLEYKMHLQNHAARIHGMVS
ncbi:MAG: hypothetical protein M1840_003447 [Geoglossum simile]|nr:MAG: hypothetical protein M1840_003447 [Geoglossum simile]